MVTQCTMCRTWFRVSREQLRAAHGLVRCSRCGTVFNALATLRDRVPTGEQPDGDAEAPAGVGGNDGGDRDTDEEKDAGEDEDEDEQPLAEAAILAPALRGRAHGRRWPWALGIAAAALVLLGQLAAADRAGLVRAPVVGPALGAVYRWFGVSAAGPLTLSRYAIANASLDALAREKGALLLHGVLRNRASRNQPLPLIAVTLTDRFGKAVRARVLTPAQYGAGGVSTLDAHQRLRFRVKLADPGVRAVGFTLTLCKRHKGRVLCQAS